jgi:CHAT domain-containing protein/tetratricopeptide (TPR) repeat protein
MIQRPVTWLAAVALAGLACSNPRGPPRIAGDSISLSRASDTGWISLADVDSLISRGDAAYAHAAFDTARSLWRRALPHLRAAADTAREARIITSLGLAAWRTGDYADARTLGEQALALKLRAGLDADLFRSYNALGLLANDEGRLDDAIARFEQASATARARGDSASLAKVASNVGLVRFALGDYQAARDGHLEARRLGRQVGDARTEGRALNNLAVVAIQLGDPRAALVALSEARVLIRSDGDRVGEQNAVGQMGSAYDALGEPRLALAAMDSALELSRKYGLRQEEADNLELIANLHRQAGDLQRALELYVQANHINETLGQKLEQGTNLRSVAEIHAALGRSDLARQKASEALQIHRGVGARLQELRDVLLLSDLESTTGASAASVDALMQTADRLTASLDARVARVELGLAKATISDRRGDARAVLRVLQSIRADLARGGFGGEWQAAALRARAFSRLNLLDSAAIEGRSAVAGLERVRGEYGSSFLRSSFLTDKLAPYTDLVDVLLRLRRTAEAFEVADGARSHALVEHLAVPADRVRSAPATVQSMAEAEAMLRHIAALVLRRDSLEDVAPTDRDSASRAKAIDLSTRLAQARDSYEALLLRVEERDAAGAALLGGRRASAGEVQRALRPNEALLEYLVTPTQVIAFVITPTSVRSVAATVSRDDLARWVRHARDLLGKRQAQSGAEDEVLGALHAKLIEPAERAGMLSAAKTLIVVPHSALAYLPFAALKRAGTSRFLVQDYALLHLPSAAALAVVRRPTNSAGISRAAVFAPFSEALTASRREADAFQRVVPASNASYGSRATEAAFRRSLAGGGVVHLATHGVMNPRNPMFSRLELASGSRDPDNDGRLEVHEVLGLRINAPLVFLSGCETGVGTAWSTQFARGDDYTTLAQAFLFAGARTVAATLWRIDDAGAAALAERFYENLRAQTPAEALAAAQRDLLATSRYARPFYWAGYQMIGESRLLYPAHKSVTSAVSR